jgi:hypothetical protein
MSAAAAVALQKKLEADSAAYQGLQKGKRQGGEQGLTGRVPVSFTRLEVNEPVYRFVVEEETSDPSIRKKRRREKRQYRYANIGLPLIQCSFVSSIFMVIRIHKGSRVKTETGLSIAGEQTSSG